MPETHVELDLQDSYRFEVDFGGNFFPLLLDEPPPLGSAAGPNASAVLGAAVGNCLSASLLFCLRRARIDVEGMHTSVSVQTERDDTGRLRVKSIDVAIEPQVPVESRARMARCLDIFEDYCVVTQSVRNGISVNARVELGEQETLAG